MNKTLKLIAIFLVASAAAVSAVWAQQAGASDLLVVSGGTLIDGNGGQPLPDAEIVIQAGRFRSVGKKGAASYPPDSKIIRADGRFIIPGLFESHQHYRDWVGELYLNYGITSAMDMGNPTDWILAIRDGINKGKIRGPRLFVSGGQMSVRSQARNPEEARKTVRELIAKGVDKIATTTTQTPEVLKVIVEEAEKANIPISGYSMYPREAVEAGVGALEHSYSIGIATKKDPEILRKIRAEQSEEQDRFIKHPLFYLVEDTYDDFIELLVRKHAVLIPDLAFDYKVINDRQKQFEQENLNLLTNPGLRYYPFDDYLPQIIAYSESGIPRPGATGNFGNIDRQSAEFQQYLRSYRNLQNLIRKLIQSGGRVLAGPDAPNMVMPGLSLHHELQLFVDAGLTPMQALMSATKWPATFLRKQDQLGTIEAGKIADLVILTANPLEDIANTKKIENVIKDGQVVDRTMHPDYTNPIPRPETDQSQLNPDPRARSLSPVIATEGDASAVLVVRGQNFVKTSVVIFDGQWIPTAFLNPGELNATIPGRLLTRAGTFSVKVWSPKPGGGMSNDLKFMVKFR